MTKIQNQLQIAYIDKNGKVHKKTFVNKNEANEAFRVLSKHNMPIATKNGMNSVKLYNAPAEAWILPLVRSCGMYWQYSLEYELLSSIWDYGLNSVDPNEIFTHGEMFEKAWIYNNTENYLTITESTEEFKKYFEGALILIGSMYTRWTISDGYNEVVMARPVI